MIQELADKVWANPRFQRSAKVIEKSWLMAELRIRNRPAVSESMAVKAMSSSAILACSNKIEHRIAALRLSTYVYETFANSKLPFDGALRVVLTRLGNFPSFATRKAVEDALPSLPLSLAADEIFEAANHTVVLGEKSNTLTTFQYSLWQDLVSEKSIALSAPTSAGKSFVLELYLASLFEVEKRLVIYVVPTRALISQVSQELKRLFGNRRLIPPEIVTVPLRSEIEVSPRAILVMTQERIQLTLQSHPELRADVIVVDEAHGISEGSRGILLQTTIEELLRRSPRTQILFASPTTKNLETFSRVFQRDDVSPVSSREPTVSQNFLIANSSFRTSGVISVIATRDTGRSFSLGEIQTKLGLRSRIEKLAHIPMALCAGQPNLIYANGADEAEEIALLLTKQLQNNKPTRRQLELSKLAKESVHPKYVLAACVERGVGFHYANIPTHLRQEIETAFADGELRYLVCTSTLLQGVNLPAKNIFMLKPTRGQGTPLESQDFWNLAGRAGRLRREFQGNIFLINYDEWIKQPLRESKDAYIQPAIEKSIKQTPEALRNIIQAKGVRASASKKVELESAFVRLFTDFQNNTLEDTFSRLDLTDEDKTRVRLELQEAISSITLPPQILRRTHNVSAHKQQRLYERIKDEIRANSRNLGHLIPLPPRDPQAFNSYARILKLCHEVILGIDTSRNLHRFHAVLAKKWMSGQSLPWIVSDAIKRQKGADTRKVIRNTLQVIEEAIRFQTIRLFGCYRTILSYALTEAGVDDLSRTIPDLELFLEIGASSKTMVSLISLGLSRVVAIKLVGARSEFDPDLDLQQAFDWLLSRKDNLASLGLSELQIKEVSELLNSKRPN